MISLKGIPQPSAVFVYVIRQKPIAVQYFGKEPLR